MKTLKHGSHRVKVPAQCPVKDLKAAIERETKVPPSLQRVIYKGKVLKDNMHIGDYGLENGNAVHMVKRGNAPRPSRSAAAGAPTGPSGPRAAAPRVVVGQIPVFSAQVGGGAPPDLNALLGNMLSAFQPQGQSQQRQGAPAPSAATPPPSGAEGKSRSSAAIQGPPPLPLTTDVSLAEIQDALDAGVLQSRPLPEGKASQDVRGALAVLDKLDTRLGDLRARARSLREELQAPRRGVAQRGRDVGEAMRRLGPVLTHLGRLLCSINDQKTPVDFSNPVPAFRDRAATQAPAGGRPNPPPAAQSGGAQNGGARPPQINVGAILSQVASSVLPAVGQAMNGGAAGGAGGAGGAGNAGGGLAGLAGLVGPMMAAMGGAAGQAPSGGGSNAGGAGNAGGGLAGLAGLVGPMMAALGGGAGQASGGGGGSAGNSGGGGAGGMDLSALGPMISNVLGSLGGNSPPAQRPAAPQPASQPPAPGAAPSPAPQPAPAAGAALDGLLSNPAGLIQSILPAFLSGGAGAPIGTLLNSVAPGLAGEIVSEGPLSPLWSALLNTRVAEIKNIVMGDASALNRLEGPLREAMRGMGADDEAKMSALAAEVTESLRFQYDASTLADPGAPSPEARVAPFLREKLIQGARILTRDPDNSSEGSSSRPTFSSRVSAWFVSMLGGALERIDACWGGDTAEARVRATNTVVFNSIARVFSAEMGAGLGFIFPMIRGVVNSAIGRARAAYARQLQGRDAADAGSGGDRGESLDNWMSHLSAAERKRWARVIDFDVDRQRSVAGRTHRLSRAYEAGAPGRRRKRRRRNDPATGAAAAGTTDLAASAGPGLTQAGRAGNLAARMRGAINSVLGAGALATADAKNVVAQVAGRGFEAAFGEQLTRDLARRVRDDPDFQQEPDSTRYPSTRGFLLGEGSDEAKGPPDGAQRR